MAASAPALAARPLPGPPEAARLTAGRRVARPAAAAVTPQSSSSAVGDAAPGDRLDRDGPACSLTHSSSRSGKSYRTWQPRVSWRARAAVSTDRATSVSAASSTVRRLSTLGSLARAAVASARAAAVRPISSRPIPACLLITDGTIARSVITIGGGGIREALRAQRGMARSAATARAARPPTTSPSSRLLDANRLAPWSPVRATSPAA